MDWQHKSSGVGAGEVLMKASGDIMGECCCVAACELAGLPPSYAIAGYFDGLFDTSCQVGMPSGAPAWDGVLVRASVFTCQYCIDPSGVALVTMQGKSLEDVNTTVSFATAGPFAGKWFMRVQVRTAQEVWHGLKTTGTNPSGIFVKDSGCAGGPASITLI